MRFFSKRARHFVLLSSITVFFLAVSFSMGVKTTNAMLGFGGKIAWVMPCPCSMNLAIMIVGVKGGVFSFEPGSIPFAWYQIFHAGPWALGTYIPGNVCLWFIPDGCAGFPTMGTILDVGTSAF